MIPQYDKSLNQGKGDRSDPKFFKKVQGPIDLVIVEGWMLGYKPSTLHSENEIDIVNRNPGMDQVNQKLFEYFKWNSLFDAAIIVTVPDKSVVFQWREQAE